MGKSPRPFDRRLFAPRRGGCAPSPSEAQPCILHKALRTVQHQRIGDTVLFGVFRHIALEKAQVCLLYTSDWRSIRRNTPPAKTPSAEEQTIRIRELERENAGLRTANNILKDALGFFAQDRKK